MNMRIPKYLRDRDPLLTNVPMLEDQVMDATEADWMAEELDNFERQMEQELLEEEFIAACFEEMLAEEEAQWHHFTGNGQLLDATTVYNSYTHEASNTEPRYAQTIFSKLNPEAPEFVPRGLAS